MAEAKHALEVLPREPSAQRIAELRREAEIARRLDSPEDLARSTAPRTPPRAGDPAGPPAPRIRPRVGPGVGRKGSPKGGRSRRGRTLRPSVGPWESSS